MKVAMIGCGMIGCSWAFCFARAGASVRLHNPRHAKAVDAVDVISSIARQLEPHGLIGVQSVDEIVDRCIPVAEIGDAVADCQWVQENAPENVDVKRDLFLELETFSPPDAILASSTSTILPDRFTEGLSQPDRAMVVHPVNPPHLIPAVEVVPGSKATPERVEQACRIMRQIGQNPILMPRPAEGFIVNRLQGALLDEAFNLVAEGYASVEDVDTAIKDGLAMRWSFMGPFETIDLNAPQGVEDFLQRYGPGYVSLGKDRPNRHPWQGSLAETVISQRTDALPRDQIAERQRWRDEQLAKLNAHRINDA